jgi:hypothetical protein
MPEIMQVDNGYKVLYLGRMSALFDNMVDAIQFSYKVKVIYG